MAPRHLEEAFSTVDKRLRGYFQEHAEKVLVGKCENHGRGFSQEEDHQRTWEDFEGKLGIPTEHGYFEGPPMMGNTNNIAIV